MNSYEALTKNEIFSKTSVPHETSFFVRLDGWKFKRLSETVGVEKPFDERFAKCLVNAGRTLFEKGFSPALVYVASDELNILFLGDAPFRGRVEKIDSVMPSLVSAAFALQLKKMFGKTDSVAFDSRIVIVPSENAVISYLAWRQTNAWRNHNNAYAYWLFRKMDYKPLEAAKKLKGMKTEEIHETLFRHGINLAETPAWQRRGILLYKKPVSKMVGGQEVVRWKVEEDWNLPLFNKEDGVKLIHKILEWFKAKRRP
ncbi:MAG: tRNA(His) guanylyltransferase Thg1 family protein [Candidatus Bathyarchaeia archaeon]